MKKLFFLFLTTLMAVGMSATSTATINFSGKTSGGDYQALDKVLVENLTQGWNETITDVTMSIDILDEEAIDVVPAENGFVVSNDAFSGTAEVAFNMKNAGKVSVFVYNVTGQCICQSTTEQEAGYHTLNLEFGTPQIYYLHISTPNRKFSHSLLNMHAGSNTQIQYVTEMGEVRHMPLYAPAAHTCKAGDQMRYTGYATYEGEEYTDEQRSVIAEGVTNIEFTFTFNSPASTVYYIKHPWGGGEWTWQQMSYGANGFTYTGVWGGTGANVNMSADDNGSEWYPASAIEGASSVSNGETVTFTFVPTNGNVGTLSVSKGEPTPTTNYFIKHPWGGGEWTWQQMTADEGEYTYTGVWGGTGANVNMSADDNGSEWYQASDIQGASSVSNGETVTFTFVPTNGNVGTLSVSKGEPTPTTNYFIKHPWGGGDWTWQHMTPGENGYTYSGAWGNNGANISMSSDGSGEKWYETSVIGNSSAATLGEEVQFVFVPTDGVIGNLSIVTSGGGGGGGEVVTPPSAPRNLSATAGSSCIVLSWSAVSDATKYAVYRSTSASGSYTYLSQTSSTSYNDCSVEKGTTYYYKVSALKNGVEGEKSSYAYATVPTGGGSSTTTPGTPTNVKVTVDGSCLKITWNAASNATEYSVFRSTSASSGYTNLQLTSGTSYKDCSVTAGTTYYYKVKAWNGNTDGNFSSYASGKVSSSGGGGTTTNKPSIPSGLKATGSESCIEISWKSVSNAQGYYLYRATSSSGNYTVVTETTSTSYTDCSVNAGTTYYYKVSAFNNDGESGMSSAVSGKTTATKPSTPTNLKATLFENAIDLTWDVVNNATKYRIYRSTSSYGNYIALDDSYTNAYKDNSNTLADGKTYYYKVSALNLAGESSQSSYASCVYHYVYIPSDPPCDPKNVSVTFSSVSMKIKWDVDNYGTGCGVVSLRKLSFVDYTTGNTVEKTTSNDYYMMPISESNKYINNGNLIFFLSLINDKGEVTWQYKYNIDSEEITNQLKMK